MKLIAKCPNCSSQTKIPSFWIGDRIELAKAKGVEFEIGCKKCHKATLTHVDDIKAVEDKTVLIIGVLSFLPALALTYLFLSYGFIAFATISIPIIAGASARQNQRTKINQFNLLYYDSKRLRQ